MAKVDADLPLLPSLLDRLIDEEPAASREPPKSRSQLPARAEAEHPPRPGEPAEHAATLPVVGGELRRVDGVAGELRDSRPGANGLELGRGARSFAGSSRRRSGGSSRGSPVSASRCSTTPEPLDRTLRFRINGLLRAEPAPEPVTFDSALQPATGNVEVKGASR